MKFDPLEAARSYSFIERLSIPERERFLADFIPQSTPAPAVAGARDLMTVAESCDWLRCSRSSLWRLEQDKVVQAVYLRGKKLFRLADLQAALTTRGGE